jgi:transposase
MENQVPNFLAEISDADWEKTPESVRKLVGQLVERIRALEERQQQLEEQLQQNSKNSSQPPSQDVAQGFKPKAQGQKRRGGQAGHAGHSQKLYAPEACAGIEEHYPSHCGVCGEVLTGTDAEPQRIQTVEIPPLRPIVIEHRFHALGCPRCGVKTRAEDASVGDSSRYGDRLGALVGLLSGEYRQSHRMVVRLLAEIFEVELSVGSVGRLRQALSEAVAVAEAHQYVQHQAQAWLLST